MRADNIVCDEGLPSPRASEHIPYVWVDATVIRAFHCC